MNNSSININVTANANTNTNEDVDVNLQHPRTGNASAVYVRAYKAIAQGQEIFAYYGPKKEIRFFDHDGCRCHVCAPLLGGDAFRCAENRRRSLLATHPSVRRRMNTNELARAGTRLSVIWRIKRFAEEEYTLARAGGTHVGGF